MRPRSACSITGPVARGSDERGKAATRGLAELEPSARPHPDGTLTAVRGTPPTRDEIDAVMLGAQLLVAVTGQSLAAVEADVSLPQLRVMVILASRGPQSPKSVARQLAIHPSNRTQNSRRRGRRDTRLFAARFVAWLIGTRLQGVARVRS
jgi:hypothetical protein